MSHNTTFPCEIKIMILAMVVSLLAGCATMRYGGAPEPTSNLNTDIDELSRHFEGSTSITKFYGNPSQKARDEFIVGRLTLMNLRYLKFIRNLTSERQLLDSATAITAMGLGLAGSMVPLAQTTRILAAVSAGVAGTKEVIDKNYYFEKTIPALVAQMNANRQIALAPLLAGSQNNLEDYPFATAVVDLNNYYIAGTFAGAIQAIQAEASKTEETQKEKNRQLTMPSPEQIAASEILNKYISKKYKELKASTGKVTDIDKIQDALLALGVKDVPPKEKEKEILDCLFRTFNDPDRKKNSNEILNALKKAGLSDKDLN